MTSHTGRTFETGLFAPGVVVVTSRKHDTYEIHVRPGLLSRVGELLHTVVLFDGQLLILTDARIRSSHGDMLADALTREGYSHCFVEVEQGERGKTLEEANRVIKRFLDTGVQRRSVVIAFGGGAITDLAGFVASIYMRGISYVNIPTTLVGQVDAAIGGKTAVDHPSAKNLVGTFFQPTSVYCDPEVLKTLPKSELVNGLAEAVKVGMIGSPELIEYIETHLDGVFEQNSSCLTQLVLASVRVKVRLLEEDPYEMNLRRALNFGHSIAHAIEASKGYVGIKHGEAVAIGMAGATRIALRRGLCSQRTADRLLRLLDRIGLPTRNSDIPSECIKLYLEPIRLIRGGSLKFVLPTEVGKTQIRDDISCDEIAWAIAAQ